MASYFLGSEFAPQAFEGTGGGSWDFTGAGFTVTAGKVTKEVSDFKSVTKQVIAYLEGGYYNPAPGYNHPGSKDPRYSTSGETMFGIDRKAGAPATAGSENKAAPAAAKKFWQKITDAQKTKKWSWNYIPPDPLQTELLDLAVEIMKPGYTTNKNNYFKNKEVLKLVESDGRLLFNFIYATWNGPGWFYALANEMTAYYNKGNKTSEALLKWVVARRIDVSGLRLSKNYSVKRGDAAWSLFNQGGLKIKTLVGLQ